METNYSIVLINYYTHLDTDYYKIRSYLKYERILDRCVDLASKLH